MVTVSASSDLGEPATQEEGQAGKGLTEAWNGRGTMKRRLKREAEKREWEANRGREKESAA